MIRGLFDSVLTKAIPGAAVSVFRVIGVCGIDHLAVLASNVEEAGSVLLGRPTARRWREPRLPARSILVRQVPTIDKPGSLILPRRDSTQGLDGLVHITKMCANAIACFGGEGDMLISSYRTRGIDIQS